LHIEISTLPIRYVPLIETVHASSIYSLNPHDRSDVNLSEWITIDLTSRITLDDATHK